MGSVPTRMASRSAFPREWKSVQALFRRAWELPEIRMAWDALILDYGEL